MLRVYSLVILHFLNSVFGEPVNIGKLESWDFNGLRTDDVTILNKKQIKIENLFFRDDGPAVWFIVGTGTDYTEEFTDLAGLIIPDENQKCGRLPGYDGEDVELTLPGTMVFTELDYLSVFCVRFNHNFGYIKIPKDELKLKFNATEEPVIDLPKECPQDVEDRTPVDEEDEEEEDS